MIIVIIIIAIIGVKVVWVAFATRGYGSFGGEKKEIIRRANYMTEEVIVSPQELLNKMPSIIGDQFKGEWALYTCSMTCAALTNIAILYSQNRDISKKYISQIIEIVLSEELREYDRMRWGEDPLDGIYGDLSHISYYSHLAWMISAYKQIGGDSKFDETYYLLCKAMNRRIRQNPNLNLPTYPGEGIYMPDMLVAIVALANYSRQNDGEYNTTVNMWMERAKSEWTDKDTGLLVSFLPDDDLIKGSYSALNCYYLTFIDEAFAKEQYEKLKRYFFQTSPVLGFKEYYDRSCWFGFDIDAGPVIMNLSTSGTAFALGASTYFQDTDVRNGILKTAEIAGSTITWFGKSHYLLSNIALVWEAVLLAMRTSVKWETNIN
jgi:hypothetical protein